MTAMDFRQYDNAIGRFVVMDQLAEFYYEHTPYNFVGSNPLKSSDPTGLDWYTDSDGNFKFNKNLNYENRETFFKDNKIEGKYLGVSATYETYSQDSNGNKLNTLSRFNLNSDGSVKNLLSNEVTEDGSVIDTGLKSITGADLMPSIVDYKNGEKYSSSSGQNYILADNEWVKLTGIMVPPSQITGFTAPVAVSFPKESWIDSGIVKHINKNNYEGSLDKRGASLGLIGQLLAEGKVSAPSLMTISVTLFFNYITSNYDRMEANEKHDQEVEKSRMNKNK